MALDNSKGRVSLAALAERLSNLPFTRKAHLEDKDLIEILKKIKKQEKPLNSAEAILEVANNMAESFDHMFHDKYGNRTVDPQLFSDTWDYMLEAYKIYGGLEEDFPPKPAGQSGWEFGPGTAPA